MPIKIQQLRFEYSERFSTLLEEFTKQHKNDDRKTFKSNWEFWKKQNQQIYDEEIERINQQGYKGCPHSKIFESVRYYYRKKQLNPQQKTKQNKQKLTGLSKTIKESMDNHMKYFILENKIDLSPAAVFADYCNNNISEITKEIFRLKSITKGQLDPISTEIKFKKAYKNRYYKFIESLQK